MKTAPLSFLEVDKTKKSAHSDSYSLNGICLVLDEISRHPFNRYHAMVAYMQPFFISLCARLHNVAANQG